MKEAGFDITVFSEEKINLLFSQFSLSKEAVLNNNETGYQFNGDGITFITLYNPLTGIRAGQDRPSKEIGFAGYIGIEGEEEIVDQMVSFIKDNSEYGEYSDSRDFI